MIRKAFRMEVFADKHEEYQKRHSPIFQDLYETLKSHGVHNYSIFLDEPTNQLFGYVEIESEEAWAAIADTEPCKRWWKYMGDVMPSNPDNSPVSRDLREVFHID